MEPGLFRLFFSPAGRLRRKPFVLLWLFWLAVLAAILTLMLKNDADDDWLLVWTLTYFACFAPSVFSIVTATIRRLRDIGYPPALALCLLIPATAPFLVGALCVWPGKPDEPERGRP